MDARQGACLRPWRGLEETEGETAKSGKTRAAGERNGDPSREIRGGVIKKSFKEKRVERENLRRARKAGSEKRNIELQRRQHD